MVLPYPGTVQPFTLLTTTYLPMLSTYNTVYVTSFCRLRQVHRKKLKYIMAMQELLSVSEPNPHLSNPLSLICLHQRHTESTLQALIFRASTIARMFVAVSNILSLSLPRKIKLISYAPNEMVVFPQ